MCAKNCINFKIHKTWFPRSLPVPKDRSWSGGRAPQSLRFSTRHILGLICGSGLRKRGKEKEKCSRHYEVSDCLNAEGVNEKHWTQMRWPIEESTRDFCIVYTISFFKQSLRSHQAEISTNIFLFYRFLLLFIVSPCILQIISLHTPTHALYIQGVTGGTDQTSGGCSLC